MAQVTQLTSTGDQDPSRGTTRWVYFFALTSLLPKDEPYVFSGPVSDEASQGTQFDGFNHVDNLCLGCFKWGPA